MRDREMITLSEKHKQKQDVCARNLVRRMTEMKRGEQSELDDLREELCIEMGRSLKSGMTRAWHVEKTDEDRLHRMAPGEWDEGRRRGGGGEKKVAF